MQGVIKFLWIPALLMITACSVMSERVEKEALPDIPFPDLVAQAATYRDRTVIVGGYVLEVTNQPDHSRMVAVQAPLGTSREPQSKDYSQGRLIVEYPGFLDPEVYAKDRKVTVAGKLLGSSAIDANPERFPYVRLQASEIHLWQVVKPIPYDPYWDPWGYPYPFYPYPWAWGPYPYHRW